MRTCGLTLLATMVSVLMLQAQPKASEPDTAWIEKTQKLPAKEQVNAVRAKLQELHQSDGKLSATIRGQLVTGCTLNTAYITELWPLRGFPELAVLTCKGVLEPGKLTSLQGLRGMTKLTYLDCSSNPKLTDFQGVEELPLVTLNALGTRIASLKALAQLKTLESLTFTLSSEGATLQPLETTGIKKLFIYEGQKLQDLAVLKKLPVKSVALQGITDLQDLSPITGLNIDELILNALPLQNLDFLSGMPLKKFAVDRMGDAELKKHLYKLPLEVLTLSNSEQIVDLSYLRTARLTSFNAYHCTKLKDLGPLKEMPLKVLNLLNTGVNSLAAVAEAPLERLWIKECRALTQLPALKSTVLKFVDLDGTGLRSLNGLPMAALESLLVAKTPLAEIKALSGAEKLKTLTLNGTSVRDFTPLKQARVIYFNIDRKLTAAEMKVLKEVPGLKEINGQPVE